MDSSTTRRANEAGPALMQPSTPRRMFLLLAFCMAAKAQTADLVVTHAYVVTMDASKHIYEDGAVVVEDGQIVAVGPSAIAARYRAARYRAARVIDAADIAMP